MHCLLHTSVWAFKLLFLLLFSHCKGSSWCRFPLLHILNIKTHFFLSLHIQVIFHHYVKDLEAVQTQYETFKHKPPVPRNAPPIAGNIMWSRQLLRRIEEPMQLFAQNKTLMAMKESKKVIKMYNRVSVHHSTEKFLLFLSLFTDG